VPELNLIKESRDYIATYNKEELGPPRIFSIQSHVQVYVSFTRKMLRETYSST